MGIYYNLEFGLKIKPPDTIVIEVTSLCNLRCKMCPSHSVSFAVQEHKRPSYMALDNIKKLIKEAVRLNPNVTISPQFQGEPLLHKDIIEIVEFAKRTGVKNIGFNTNAVLLDKEKGKALINAGLDDICFSADGLTKEVYEKIRIGANYEKVYENMLNFIEYKNKKKSKKPNINITFTLQDENALEVDDFIKFWFSKVSCIYINNVTVKGRPLIKRKDVIPRKPCPDLWRFMIILTDGDVVPCCRDFEYTQIMGNALKTSIKEVWEGKLYQEIRQYHLKGEFNKIDICNDCDTWMAHFPIEEKIEDGKRIVYYAFHKGIFNEAFLKSKLKIYYKKIKRFCGIS